MNKHIEKTPSYSKSTSCGCCSLDSAMPSSIQTQEHTENDGHNHGELGYRTILPAAISLVMLLSGLALDHWLKADFFKDNIRLAWYALAYIPVGLPVITEAIKLLGKGEVFTEFFLMSIATIGAFAIGEYPEGVAVMLFYAVGELFQSTAVNRAKDNIKALLDVRPKTATVLTGETSKSVDPRDVSIDDLIQIKVGEKVPLDGTLITSKAVLNTAALTGESKPESIYKDDRVMAGYINLENVITVKVDKLFEDSSIARILEMVQNATARKSKTELLIRRLARIYTPIVVYLAIAICLIPYFFVESYVFNDWLYRALIFLVISCPCALVISIPLGYFGGLGAASKNGILFKGATYLDQLTKVNTLVMDKTGTVTKGVFNIQDIATSNGFQEDNFMPLLMAVESKSTHPVAKAIMGYPLNDQMPAATEIREIAGKGIIGTVSGKHIVAGNHKIMEEFNIPVPAQAMTIVTSIVFVSIDGVFAGYVTIADELKEDAKRSIDQIRTTEISNLMILSGDKDSITQEVANQLGIDKAKGGLLPEDKLREVESIKQDKTKVVAFVGDGINDAPVLAASDVGIAMGGLGSDVAIETADVIIQTDELSKIAMGIKIGKSTQRIIWQNISIAFGVKIMVLILGAIGLATMWAAVFADVGVAFIAILNAIRVQKMH